jgi:hypothetical protein
MNELRSFLTILTIGAIGAIVFTAVTHPDGIKALFGGVDSLYKTAQAGSLGQVA